MRPLLLLPLLLLPACGGSDEAQPPSPKQAYVAQAEAVCTKGNEARDALAGPASVAEVPGFVRSVVTQAADVTAELAALEPPEQDAAELKAKFIAPLQQQVQKGMAFSKQVEATAAKDPAGLLALLPQAPLDTVADLGFLRSYGFRSCVELADTSAANPLGGG